MTLSNIEAVRARCGLPSNCSKCGSLAVFVIESRVTGSARRRRKRCDRCGFRETTYEITRDEYKELKGKWRPKPKPSNTPHKANCNTCLYWDELGGNGEHCDMDFPEAGGWFADECSCYQKRSK